MVAAIHISGFARTDDDDPPLREFGVTEINGGIFHSIFAINNRQGSGHGIGNATDDDVCRRGATGGNLDLFVIATGFGVDVHEIARMQVRPRDSAQGRERLARTDIIAGGPRGPCQRQAGHKNDEKWFFHTHTASFMASSAQWIEGGRALGRHSCHSETLKPATHRSRSASHSGRYSFGSIARHAPPV